MIKGLCNLVDNHCQFLPQEQVHNFSLMDHKELLNNTKNYVGKLSLSGLNIWLVYKFLLFAGNPYLLENDFVKLKKMQDNFGRVVNHQDKDEEKVRKLKEDIARFEKEAKNFR